MATAWIPPRRSYHLRVFAICLALVVVALLSFLFGVQLEAIRPASGVMESANTLELRAPVSGLIELSPREDSTGPAPRKLETGDLLKPGDPIAHIARDETNLAIRKLEARIKDHESAGKPVEESRAQLGYYREQLTKGRIDAPKEGHWLVARLAVAHHQAVKAGDLIARLVPADASTGKPSEVLAELQIAESHAADVTPGQPVRLYSSMYAQRLHGHADGRIERIEPIGEPGPKAERIFRAKAIITSAPFPLHLGSSVRAEIVVGKKQVYKIIFEH